MVAFNTDIYSHIYNLLQCKSYDLKEKFFYILHEKCNKIHIAEYVLHQNLLLTFVHLVQLK